MIYILPGMGADQRMYTGAWRSLADATFIDWPADLQEETITTVADRVVKTFNIPDGATIVGSSLGGIVACEIAKIRKIEHLFLVGSAKNRGEINGVLQVLHPLIDLAPLPLLQQLSGKIPHDIFGMFRESDALFIRNMCRAVFSWNGLEESAVRIHRIHGRFDLMIPPPLDTDELINGGHLIAMTHPLECIRFINTHMTSLISSPKVNPQI